MKKLFLLLLFIGFVLGACKQEIDSLPKPRMYPKVVFPQKDFQAFHKEDCPFSFQYPKYAAIQQTKAYYNEEQDNSCWFDIAYTPFKATLYCSYASITDQEDFLTKVKKNYILVNKHNRRADYINENIIVKDKHPVGVRFEIEGEVATPFQFFLTDTLNHFFRASLYFNVPPNPDSIAPIYQFVKQDLDEMIGSFEWD